MFIINKSNNDEMYVCYAKLKNKVKTILKSYMNWSSLLVNGMGSNYKYHFQGILIKVGYLFLFGIFRSMNINFLSSKDALISTFDTWIFFYRN